MEGRVHAANRKREDDLSLAWHVAAFDRQKRLEPLSKYLAPLRPAREQSADEVAAIFKALKAKGKSVKIRKVKRDGDTWLH